MFYFVCFTMMMMIMLISDLQLCLCLIYNLYNLAEMSYAVVTCEIKLFENYFSLRRHPSETILPENISK